MSSIVLPTPIEVPPASAKVYNSLWVRELTIGNATATTAELRIVAFPYNTETKEVRSDMPVIIHTDKFWQLIDDVPEAKDAMEAVFGAIPLIKTWVENNP
jgi:hypothetical protein